MAYVRIGYQTHPFNIRNYFIFSEHLLCLRHWLTYHSKYKNEFHVDSGLNEFPALRRGIIYMLINYRITQVGIAKQVPHTDMGTKGNLSQLFSFCDHTIPLCIYVQIITKAPSQNSTW